MPEVVSHTVERYALGQGIAAGGMATLHLGRLAGSAGFSRTVAIKKLHSHLCVDPNFVKAFGDEARLAARIRHPNVVPTLDVISTEPSEAKPAELLIVMEYIDGESLSALWRSAGQKIPLPIVVAIVSEMLHGLHSAHEAKSESGEPLGIVHRDVSPQNVLVGADGVARLVDFGVARATGRVGTTNDGEIKGKLAYMAPEQIRNDGVTRKSDVFAAGVVLWELLTGERLFQSDNPGSTLEKILVGWVAPPSSIARDLPSALDDITMRALDADPQNRFETARDMAIALEDASRRALGREVSAWVEANAGQALARRRDAVLDAERGGVTPLTTTLPPPGETNRDLRDLRDPISSTPAMRPGQRLAFAPGPTSAAERPLELTLTQQSHIYELSSEHFIEERIISEPTITVFSGENETLLPVSSTGPQHATVQHSGGSGKAIAIIALAASLTLFFGTRHGTAKAARAAEATTSPATLVDVTPVPVTTAAKVASIIAPPPSPAMVALAPPVSPLAAPPRTPTMAPPSASTPAQGSAAARRTPRARPTAPAAPVRTPCVAKLDPATGKTVYKGDCD